MEQHSKVGEMLATDPATLDQRARPLLRGTAAAGIIGLLAAAILALVIENGGQRFFLAYLVNFSFFLSISLGAIFFVLIQHLARAGWSVSVRRIAEVFGAAMPVLAVLSLPIILAVFVGGQSVYPWTVERAHVAPGFESAAEHALETPHGEDVPPLAAQHQPLEGEPLPEADAAAPHGVTAGGGHAEAGEHGAGGLDYLLEHKRVYLNAPFFVARLIVYFAVWSFIGWWYWRQSTRQDESGDVQATVRQESFAGPLLLLFALTLTFGAFDLIMSLSPAWYSTIFGVYYFAGGAVGFFATIILALMWLQRNGVMQKTVNREHYHDLGKFLFGFVFFWGYIAFSQYMLLWYASLPETVFWFEVRGATTVPSGINAWSYVIVLLLFGHFIIPFLGLMSRHVKRRRASLAFWCVWLLVFHWIDLWWLIMPEAGAMRLPVMEILTLVGVGGVWLAMIVQLGAMHRLLPTGDPRLHEALGFQNI